MATGGGFTTAMVSTSRTEPAVAAASVRPTVKLAGPGAVGVPEMMPVTASSARPAGSDPAATDQRHGGVPPVPANCCWYFTPVVPAGSEVVVIPSGPAGVIVI